MLQEVRDDRFKQHLQLTLAFKGQWCECVGLPDLKVLGVYADISTEIILSHRSHLGVGPDNWTF